MVTSLDDKGTFSVQIFSISGIDEQPYLLAISPDRTTFLSTCRDNTTVKIWSLETPSATYTLETTLSGHSKSVTAAAFNAEGTRIVTGSEDLTVRIWEAESGTCVRTFTGHRDVISLVAFNPDGSVVLSTSYGGKTINLWAIDSGVCLKTLSHDTSVLHATFSPDGSSICTSCRGANLKLYGPLG